MARRSRKSRPSWTPNQIVAHNIAKARLLRGWTQDQAAVVAFASAELLLGQAPVDADREDVIATWVEMVMGLVAAPDVSEHG